MVQTRMASAQSLSLQMAQARSIQTVPAQLAQTDQAVRATIVQGKAQAGQLDAQARQAELAQSAQARLAQAAEGGGSKKG